MQNVVNYLKNKKIILYGMGISNQSISKFLNNLNIEYKVYVDEKIGIDKKFNLTFDSDTLIIKSNGIKPNTNFLINAKKANCVILNDLELYSLLSKEKVLAITGSNGKTTTCNLLNKLLNKKKKTILCGNNGSPIFDYINEETDYKIIECSSFMLDNVKIFHPHVYIILNIEYHHIDYHETFSNYLDAKLKPLVNMNKNDLVIFNYDDKILKRQIANFDLNIKSFSLHPNSIFCNCYIMDDAIYYEGKEFIKLNKLKSTGKHNLQNIMAVIITGKFLDFEDNLIKEVIINLDILPHRLEKFYSFNDIIFYNDSKATNPYATLKALEFINEIKNHEKVFLIMGGKIIPDDYDVLNKELKKVDYFYLYGENKLILKNHLMELGIDKEINIFENIEEVVICLRKRVGNNAVILFSPASTSFDQFKNFEDRGEQFKSLVLKFF